MCWIFTVCAQGDVLARIVWCQPTVDIWQGLGNLIVWFILLREVVGNT